jgi:hypothetical protein
MATPRYRYRFQLHDRGVGAFAGPPITGAGGVVRVCVQGSPLWATLTQKDGTSQTNPVSLTRGSAEFYSTESKVDLFIQCPDGQFVCMWNVQPDAVHEIPVDRDRKDQTMVIPVHITNYPATVETDTGFDEPTQVLFRADAAAVNVTTADATETVDVGTATAETGDPDGWIAAASVGSVALVWDNGALFASAAPHVSTGKSIVVTTTAGSDTFQGYVCLGYTICKVNMPTLNP